MNERIKELSMQAHRYANYQQLDPTQFVLDIFEEKFVELLVQECVETLGTYENTWTHEEKMNLLKKHFGVE
jgi:hypothetical protein